MSKKKSAKNAEQESEPIVEVNNDEGVVEDYPDIDMGPSDIALLSVDVDAMQRQYPGGHRVAKG